MKNIEFCVAAMLFLPLTAMTQQIPGNQETDTSTVIGSRFNYFSRAIPISQMDQRKIYNWGNGQRSTPTGRQAYERNAKFAKVFRDSAVVVPPPASARRYGQGTGRRSSNRSNWTSYSRVVPISQMDQRKIYNWGNGQRSTPTGRQAYESNVNFVRVFGDSAIVVQNPYVKNDG